MSAHYTENLNHLYPWATLDTFQTDTPQMNLDVIRNQVVTEFENTDTLLIINTSGNGGSHLLHALGNQLLKMKKNIYCISAPRLVQEYEKGNSWLLKDIMNSKYLLIDGFHHTSDLPRFRSWFQASLSRRTMEGKKAILSCAVDNMQDGFLPAFSAGLGRVEKAYATRPGNECLEKIISRLFDQAGMLAGPAVIKALLGLGAPSVGQLKVLAKFIIIQALEKKINLSKMTERQFIFQFNKQLKQFTSPRPDQSIGTTLSRRRG